MRTLIVFGLGFVVARLLMNEQAKEKAIQLAEQIVSGNGNGAQANYHNYRPRGLRWMKRKLRKGRTAGIVAPSRTGGGMNTRSSGMSTGSGIVASNSGSGNFGAGFTPVY